MKMFRSCALLFGLAVAGLAAAHGQAIPAATQPGVLTVGGDISYGKTDIFPNRTYGAGVFANFDFTEHISIDADAHIQALSTPDDYIENSYELGPRYNFHYGRYTPYVKVLIGIGTTSISDNRIYEGIPQPASYFIYSPGGGVDIKVKGHWMARVDGEYQFWPGFTPHGLTPFVASVGIGYRFHP